MSEGEEMSISTKGRNISEEDFEKNADEVEEILTKNFDNKWLFPRASYYLGTTLRSGTVRPLSPTLKIHSPESVFPGIAILCEGFDDMREWKNTIEFVGFFARKGNMFNSRHHWDMRTKFLDVRVRCMDKIVEDPCRVNRNTDGRFFVCIPVAVKKAMEEEKRKTKLTSHVDVKNELSYRTKGNSYTVKRNYANKAHEINIDGENVQVQHGSRSLGIENGNSPAQDTAGDNMRGDLETWKDDIEIQVTGRDIQTTSDRFVSVAPLVEIERTKAHAKPPNELAVSVDDTHGRIHRERNEVDAELRSCYNCSYSQQDSTSPTKVTLAMLREQRRLEKQSVSGKENKEDEKLQCESLQEGLNIESGRETLRSLPTTSAEYKHFESASSDDVQDLIVIGKSVPLKPIEMMSKEKDASSNESEDAKTKKRFNSKSETWPYKFEEELVLEDINEKDFVPDLSLSSSCKLKQNEVRNDTSDTDTANSSKSKALLSESQNKAKRCAQDRTVSRLQTLRKRIRSLFSCFGKSQVTPVDV